MEFESKNMKKFWSNLYLLIIYFNLGGIKPSTLIFILVFKKSGSNQPLNQITFANHSLIVEKVFVLTIFLKPKSKLVQKFQHNRLLPFFKPKEYYSFIESKAA